MDPNQLPGKTPSNHVNQPFQPYPIQPGVPPPTPGLIPKAPKKPSQVAWGLVIPLIISVLLLLGSAGFGVWAFTSRQEFKNASDQISAKAVAIAVQQEDTKKDKEFVEKEKSPYKIYQGPEAYGSLNISYPKTWSAYIVETTRSGTPIDGYLHPNFVPGTGSGTAFALRVQVTNSTYEQELKQFEAAVKTGKVTVSPYIPKNVSGVTGARVTGEIALGQSGSMVLLPLRDKTIKLSAGAQQFIGDFDKIILENFKFVP